MKFEVRLCQWEAKEKSGFIENVFIQNSNNENFRKRRGRDAFDPRVIDHLQSVLNDLDGATVFANLP